jgi:peptide chain release factor
MINFGVSIRKQNNLHDKMVRLKINEHDIEEKFIRSQGKGGQNVNKTSTCVFLKHLPTGLIVKCQRERSQLLNRYYARILLLKKIENLILQKESDEQKKIAKIKKQKQKRSKRAKEKILKDKKIQSKKKAERSYLKKNLTGGEV